MPMDISEDHPWSLFSQCEPIEDVISKAGIATGDFVLQVTVTRKNFLDIPDTLICQGTKHLGYH